MDSLTLFKSDYHKAFVHKSSVDYIRNEFHEITNKGNDFNVQYSVKEATKPKNECHNRYRDILPYDSTRVKLKKGGYINANWVKGFEADREFIATQGPKAETARHFWEMVIEQKVKVIVMLCKLQETNKRTGMVRMMCNDYWPLGESSIKTIESDGVLDPITLTTTEEKDFGGYIRRQITVTDKSGHHRKVTHFQMTSWPDYGVPNNRDDVFNLIKEYRRVTKNDKAPIVMHCSAGVGRTGTIIAVDKVLHMKEKNNIPKKFKIKELVIDLRRQRMKMVQSEEQYRFLYPTVYKIFFNQDPPSSSNSTLSGRNGNGTREPLGTPITRNPNRRSAGSPRSRHKDRPNSELFTPERNRNLRKSRSVERLDIDPITPYMSETLLKAGKKPPKRSAAIYNPPITTTDGPDLLASSCEDLSSELRRGPGPLRRKNSIEQNNYVKQVTKPPPVKLKDRPKALSSMISSIFSKKKPGNKTAQAKNVSAEYSLSSRAEPLLIPQSVPSAPTKVPKWKNPQKTTKKKSIRRKAKTPD